MTMMKVYGGKWLIDDDMSEYELDTRVTSRHDLVVRVVAWMTGQVEFWLIPAVLVAGYTTTQNSPFLPPAVAETVSGLRLPTEGWPGWVRLNGLDKYRDGKPAAKDYQSQFWPGSEQLNWSLCWCDQQRCHYSNPAFMYVYCKLIQNFYCVNLDKLVVLWNSLLSVVPHSKFQVRSYLQLYFFALWIT